MSAPLPSPQPALAYPDERPPTRAGCMSMPRPCPFLLCRHHLAVDIDARGRLRPVNQAIADAIAAAEAPPPPGLTPNELGAHTRKTDAIMAAALATLPHTCSLDVANDGNGRTLDEVGAILGDISRERVRQLEQSAQAKLARFGIILDVAEGMDLDTTKRPTGQRPSPAQGHPPPPRRPDPAFSDGGVHYGAFAPENLTAKMRKIQAESAAPVKTVTLPPEEIARVEAEIAAKRNPLRKPRPLVTLDTLSQRAEASRMRAGAATASTTRITAPPAKAPTATQPRPPSPPSTPSPETPPQVLPAAIQPDDQPEVAVAAALPEPPPAPPSIPQQPMTRPDMRTRRSVYEDANETAKSNLAKIMAARGITRESLSAMARDTHTAHTPMSVDQAIVRAMNGTASPVSVWYRRIASLLGVPLSDLCADPAWLAAVAPEDSPVAAAHAKPAPPPLSPIPAPPSPDASTKITPLFEALTLAQNQLSHVAGAAAHLEARAEDLEAVAKVLRDEIDSLQQQLAERTRERDEARKALAQIDAALTLTRKACP